MSNGFGIGSPSPNSTAFEGGALQALYAVPARLDGFTSLSTDSMPPVSGVSSGSSPQDTSLRNSTEATSSMDVDVVSVAPTPTVCSQCESWARVGSKYCSNACGVAWHLERVSAEKEAEVARVKRERFERRCAVVWLEIEASLEKKQYWSAIEEEDAKLLAAVEVERKNAFAVVAKILLEQAELELEIQTNQAPLIVEGVDAEEEETGAEERNDRGRNLKLTHFDCPYCGVSPTGSAPSLAHHLISCFQKFESLNAVSGPKPMQPGDVIYCDHFDPKTNMYCKKLRASCYAHSGVLSARPMPGVRVKATANEGREICGARTASEDNSENGRCKVLRKDCTRHFNWEHFARKQLDLQLISHQQLAEGLAMELASIKEKMIFTRLSRGLKGTAQVIPGPAADIPNTHSKSKAEMDTSM